MLVDPGNYSFIEAEIKLNDTWTKEINESVVTVMFNVETNESSKRVCSHCRAFLLTGKESRQFVAVQLGRCIRHDLDVTVKSAREQSVFVGGDLLWLFETREQVNQYCRVRQQLPCDGFSFSGRCES